MQALASPLYPGCDHILLVGAVASLACVTFSILWLCCISSDIYARY